jgi:hypothetical protein
MNTASMPGAGRGRVRDHAEAAAWLHGATEALGVLIRRSPAERQRASRYAAELLIREVEPADWGRAGLPAAARLPAGREGGVPVYHRAVIHLAWTAMSLHCSGLGAVQRASLWARLADFFAQIVPPGDPWLGRLRERALSVRADAEDVPDAVIEGLFRAYERHRDTDGGDAYLTSLARANLATGYCQRGTGRDLTEAVTLCRQEVRARTDRYGADHPVTLVARSLLTRCLLAQAEATEDQGERLRLARQALDDTDRVRAARDRLFGAVAHSATLSRRYQGHALLLLGDLERARACLQYTLSFETVRNGNREWHGSGQAHLLLARVQRALGDRQAALDHARQACRLLAADVPAGPSHRAAGTLLQELESGSGVTTAAGR